MEKFDLVFDEIISKQLRKIAKNLQVKKILSKMFDKLEYRGPSAGKLLDSRLFVYEMKTKHPSIRLYFKYNSTTKEIYIFEFEMKKDKIKQQKIINKIKNKILKIFSKT